MILVSTAITSKNGGVAIFCGRKDTVKVVLRRFIELNDRKI